MPSRLFAVCQRTAKTISSLPSTRRWQRGLCRSLVSRTCCHPLADGKGLCSPPGMPLPSAMADGKVSDSCSGGGEAREQGVVATGSTPWSTAPRTGLSTAGVGSSARGPRTSRGGVGASPMISTSEGRAAGQHGEEAGKTTRETLDALLPSKASPPGPKESSRGSGDAGRGASAVWRP